MGAKRLLNRVKKYDVLTNRHTKILTDRKILFFVGLDLPPLAGATCPKFITFFLSVAPKANYIFVIILSEEARYMSRYLPEFMNNVQEEYK